MEINAGDNIAIDSPGGNIYGVVIEYSEYSRHIVFVVEGGYHYVFDLSVHNLILDVIKENDYVLRRYASERYVPIPIITPEVLDFWKGEKGETPKYVEIENRHYNGND